MPKVYVSALLGLLLFALSGCSMFGEKPDKTREWSAERLYREAKSAMSSHDYETAIEYYEKLESRFPFGPLAQQSQIEIAYTYYKDDQSASAIAAADRFIKLYPDHPNVDYAYYLKGLVNFNQGKGLFDRYLPMDESERDPGSALAAFLDFSELVNRFPERKYSEDARQRMLFLRNNLAKHEVHVAGYYMRRKAYLAAANRAKYVIENYPRTPAVPEALVTMVKAYRLLGLEDLAGDAMRVLTLNYPDHVGVSELAAVDHAAQ